MPYRGRLLRCSSCTGRGPLIVIFRRRKVHLRERCQDESPVLARRHTPAVRGLHRNNVCSGHGGCYLFGRLNWIPPLSVSLLSRTTLTAAKASAFYCKCGDILLRLPK